MPRKFNVKVLKIFTDTLRRALGPLVGLQSHRDVTVKDQEVISFLLHTLPKVSDGGTEFTCRGQKEADVFKDLRVLIGRSVHHQMFRCFWIFNFLQFSLASSLFPAQTLHFHRRNVCFIIYLVNKGYLDSLHHLMVEISIT